jgi:hypothetical protein
MMQIRDTIARQLSVLTVRGLSWLLLETSVLFMIKINIHEVKTQSARTICRLCIERNLRGPNRSDA